LDAGHREALQSAPGIVRHEKAQRLSPIPHVHTMVIFLEFAISASYHVIAAQPQVRQVMEQQAAAAGELSNLRRSTTAPPATPDLLMKTLQNSKPF
jgi:hypothetical protein